MLIAEVASLVAILERIDEDLSKRGPVNRRGTPRTLLDYRLRISRQLDRLLHELGATPAARVAWALDINAEFARDARVNSGDGSPAQ